MQTVVVKLTNEKALNLLQQLEQLNIIELITQNKKVNTEKTKRSWAGSISKETANKMLKYVEESRNEWDRNI